MNFETKQTKLDKNKLELITIVIYGLKKGIFNQSIHNIKG